MFFRSVLVAYATFVLLAQNQGMSLASPQKLVSSSKLQKRATWNWWTWSSNGGFKSGTGTPPTTVNFGGPQVGSYANIQIGAQPFSSSSSQLGSSNSGGYTPNSGDSYSSGPPPSPAPSGPKVSVPHSDIQAWLGFHNKFRAQYGAKPLKWNPILAAASKRLVDTCVWHHTDNNPYGENMSAGQQSIEEVVSGWVNGPEEKGSYNPSNTVPSHFTQVVYLATTEVGCYKNICSDVRGANLPQSPVTFWGCNYNPPGNVIGQIAQNVKAAPGGAPSRSGGYH